MKHSSTRWFAATVTMLALGCGVVGAAQTARPSSFPATRAGAGTRTTSTSRVVLPDPTLLDGSKHTAEKRSEYGMIGDFELPGDENAQSGKVGGGSGGEGQQPAGENGGLQAGMPAGGGGQKDAAAGKPAAQKGAEQIAQAAGGGQDSKASDKPGGGGAGDPNAQAQGIKVAELGGDPSGAIDPSALGKPSPMAIGDQAMRIPQTPGATTAAAGSKQQIANQNTQVYEKATGTGGKGPTGVQGPNRTEKGRTIPAGL